MVISSVGMLMLSAQFASSVTFPSTLRRSLALKSNVLRSEGLPDGQSIRNGRTADGERQREKGKRTEIRETIQGKQVKGSNSKSEGILMRMVPSKPLLASPRRILYLRGRLPPLRGVGRVFNLDPTSLWVAPKTSNGVHGRHLNYGISSWNCYQHVWLSRSVYFQAHGRCYRCQRKGH